MLTCTKIQINQYIAINTPVVKFNTLFWIKRDILIFEMDCKLTELGHHSISSCTDICMKCFRNTVVDN